MAASMKEADPELRRYLRNNKLPDIYEALLSGISIMTPDDPIEFLIDKITRIRHMGLENINWDMFIEADKRPVVKMMSESNLDYIFNCDEVQPTPEMYAMAYSHYNRVLAEATYRSWMKYYLQKKYNRQLLIKQMAIASRHHSHRLLRERLTIWKNWLKFRKGRQAMSYQKIQHVYAVSLGRVIFEAWYIYALDARKTREYFEYMNRLYYKNEARLERGEAAADEEEQTNLEGSGEARDSISNLPRKVAIKIFSYLTLLDISRCASVCRSWKVITQASILWSKVNLSAVKENASDRAAVRLLAKCRPYLVHLNLRGCHSLKTPTFLCISECKNIQDLNLSQCSSLTDDMFSTLSVECNVLLYLNISYTNLTDFSLLTMANNFTSLQYLSLAYCEKFTDKGLLYLSSGHNSEKLTYLDLSGCAQLTPQGFINLTGTAKQGYYNLQTFIVDNIPALNDDYMLPVVKSCVNLTYVSFLGSPLLTDATFKELALNKMLKKIKIHENNRISDQSVKLLGKHCPNLNHVYLSDCNRLTDASMKALANCKYLRVLNVADCVRISDTGVRHLVEGPCGVSLHELNLTNCVRVGDMAIVNINKKCPNIVYLSLCYCDHITNAGIELIGNMAHLISVDITGCQFDDQALSSLGHSFRLKDITISECSGITDLGLQKFVQQCKDVERIDVSYCPQITDGAIKNLAFCCRMLMSLNIAGCDKLTDLSIQYLSGVCHYLAYLDISGCVLISDKSLKFLRRGCKKMKSLKMLKTRVPKSAVNKMAKALAHVEYSPDETAPMKTKFGK